MNKRYLPIVLTLIALVMFAAQQHTPLLRSSLTASSGIATTSDVSYPVVKVVDGNTLEIDKSGISTKVRLIGIDTPEVADPRRPVQCFGREASSKAHDILDGARVILETDPSQDEYDKYGRLLAYVFLPDGNFVNEFMIAQGYAHEYTYDLPYKYQSTFKAAEKKAREAQRGLWAPNTCNGNTAQPATPKTPNLR